MKKHIVFITLMLIYKFTLAQFNETIRTGRPGQAIGPFAVGKNVLQTQTGLDFGGTNTIGNFSSNFIAPNTVIRYGLSNNFEINTGWEYRTDTYKKDNLTYSTNGISLSSIGMRVNLRDGGNTPSIGVQTSFKLPILADAYNFDYVAPRILLIVSQRISNKFSGLINTGINYNGNNPKPVGVYVMNLSYSINDKWGTFIENYGSFDNQNWTDSWDTGLSYLANNNLQFDIYGGYDSENNIDSYFVSLGISWRLIPKQEK